MQYNNVILTFVVNCKVVVAHLKRCGLCYWTDRRSQRNIADKDAMSRQIIHQSMKRVITNAIINLYIIKFTIVLFFSRWNKVTSFIRSPHCSVKNLDIGKEYDFRVCAENEFGVSEPLITEEPILARHPFGKCRVSSALILQISANTIFLA